MQCFVCAQISYPMLHNTMQVAAAPCGAGAPDIVRSHIYVYMNLYSVHIYIYTYMCIYDYVCLVTLRHTSDDMEVVYMYLYRYVYLYIYICTYVYIYIYTYIHSVDYIHILFNTYGVVLCLGWALAPLRPTDWPPSVVGLCILEANYVLDMECFLHNILSLSRSLSLSLPLPRFPYQCR